MYVKHRDTHGLTKAVLRSDCLLCSISRSSTGAVSPHRWRLKHQVARSYPDRLACARAASTTGCPDRQRRVTSSTHLPCFHHGGQSGVIIYYAELLPARTAAFHASPHRGYGVRTDRVVAHSSRQRHCVLRSHTTRERFRGVRITRKPASPHPPQTRGNARQVPALAAGEISERPDTAVRATISACGAAPLRGGRGIQGLPSSTVEGTQHLPAAAPALVEHETAARTL